MSELNFLAGHDIAEDRITHFLTVRGLYLSDLLRHINERIRPASEAIIFCSGSALDGFANNTSDLDVFVISKYTKAENLPIINAY
jgi:predicted nucleotidyltransferase